jgi:regulatory protein
MKEWKTEGPEKERMTPPDGEAGKAAVRAMKLLLYKQRSEKELKRKLLEEEFSEDAVSQAVKYCASFGYVDDRRYAENYLLSYREKKSCQVIRNELAGKGIGEKIIEDVMEEHPYDENEIADALIQKKAGQPHRLDDRELRRTYAFLARKGFSSSVIWGAIRRYQESVPEED